MVLAVLVQVRALEAGGSDFSESCIDCPIGYLGLKCRHVGLLFKIGEGGQKSNEFLLLVSSPNTIYLRAVISLII